MTDRDDLTGKRFGIFLVTERGHRTLPSGRRLSGWLAICDCGSPMFATTQEIRRGRKSCGCLPPRRSREQVPRFTAKVRPCVRCGLPFGGATTPGNQRFCSDTCRFLSKVLIGETCWTWTGTRHAKGYGHFKMGGAVEKAHRASLQILKGLELGDLHVLHQCDNPSCVNPDHLRLGTNDENVADRQGKKRQSRGERAGCAILTADAVLDIRTKRMSITEFAALYGASESTIRHAQSGRSWGSDPHA